MMAKIGWLQVSEPQLDKDGCEVLGTRKLPVSEQVVVFKEPDKWNLKDYIAVVVIPVEV